MPHTKSAKTKTALEPGDTIGIVGGGQLGRMLAAAAARLGLKTIVLEPDADCPAAQCANSHIIAAYDDKEALEKLCSASNVVTYEFENVPAEAAQISAERSTLFPPAAALETAQDRLIEKRFFAKLGIATAPFFAISSLDELKQNAAGFDGILKTRRFGYDGKGQARIRPDFDEGALKKAWRSLDGAPAILEGFVDFEREISVIATRGQDGGFACFDPAENIHQDGILHRSIVPATTNAETANTAKQIAKKTLSALDYVGVIGIEFFVMTNGDLLVNEMAPRVHNSGHWTEAACAVSQFEQHIRAVAGWPLGEPSRHSDCVMENLIGDDIEKLLQLLSEPQTLLHLYGKAETRPGRKMGHFTRLKPKS